MQVGDQERYVNNLGLKQEWQEEPTQYLIGAEWKEPRGATCKSWPRFLRTPSEGTNESTWQMH